MDQPTKVSAQKCIIEGQAEIRLTSAKVFYNPVQEFNRDLSIVVLNVFTEDYKQEQLAKAVKNKQKFSYNNMVEDGVDDNTNAEIQIPVTILEALSATGLRSIRYAKEVSNVTKIIANDFSKEAVETMKLNVVYNGVDSIVETSLDDACILMYKHKDPTKRFAVIDLDPYGSPSVFLDAAVQSVEEGGLLLVTATDMAVLAGNSPESCYSKYGAISLKTKCCHEMALRILLQCIESHANRYNRYIVPLISLSADFYVRVFVKVYSGAVHSKKTISKLSMVYSCVGCDNITLQPLGGFKPNPIESNPAQVKTYLPLGPVVGQKCDNCDQKHHMGGPIWSARIHDTEFVNKAIKYIQENVYRFGTAKRIEGVLSVINEEIHDAPLYYALDKMSGRVHLQTMPMVVMRSAILNAGYQVSYSHAAKMSVKTNAPAPLIWDIIRTWEKSHPVKPAKVDADVICKAILSRPIIHNVDLAEHPDSNPVSRKEGQLRYQFNPTPHWGPGARAAVNTGDVVKSKAVRNQNKNLKKRNLSKSSEKEEPRKKMHREKSFESKTTIT